MTLQEKIQKKAERYGQLASVFLESAKFALENQWINVKEDLPCNHKDLLLSTGYHTVSVFTYKKGGACGIDNMIIRNGKWEWEAWKENYLYWMTMPNLPKEKEVKL